MTDRPIQGRNTGLPSANRTAIETLIKKGQEDPNAIRTLRCRTVAKGRFSQLNYIRDLPPQPVVENDVAGLLGEDIAPNSSEALLAAFGSCLAMGIHANAIVRNIPLRRLELEVEADLHTSAVWGTADVTPKPLGFATVRVSVTIVADASRDSLNDLIQHAALWSPVANTLHNPVHLDVALAPDILGEAVR